MHIKKSDLVLEIGSGNNPFHRSDVLLDKFLSDSTERFSPNIIIDRPFVVGDACKLPFKNQIFDYIICRHVLEHLEKPENFLQELMRVGKAGYIETPSAISEKLFGWPFHKWMVNQDEDRLILEAKTKTIQNPEFNQIFHKMYACDYHFHSFFDNHPEIFFTCFEWQKVIFYQIKRNKLSTVFTHSNIDSNFHKSLKQSKKSKTFYYQYIKTLRKISNFINGKRDFNLNKLIACPNCKSDLKKKTGNLYCSKCQKKFPLIDDIPILL